MGRTNRAGLTLIELLVVTVLVALLAGIALPRLSLTRERAFRSAVASDLRNLAFLEELHLQEHGSYTASLDLLGLTPSRGVEVKVSEASDDGWAATATHASLGAGGCGIFIGKADPAGGAPATSAGSVACDF